MKFRLGSIVRHKAAGGHEPSKGMVELHEQAKAIRRIQRQRRALRAKAVAEYKRLRALKEKAA